MTPQSAEVLSLENGSQTRLVVYSALLSPSRIIKRELHRDQIPTIIASYHVWSNVNKSLRSEWMKWNNIIIPLVNGISDLFRFLLYFFKMHYIFIGNKLHMRNCIAAAKSLQLCPTLCNPIESSPPGSPVPGILQARTLEWVAIAFSNVWKWKVKVKLLSRVRLLASPWTAAYQTPRSMGFSRQEYWSGVPLPSVRNCIRCWEIHNK